MTQSTLPRKASHKAVERFECVHCLEGPDVDLVCEALRMMSDTLVEETARVHRIMPEAQILERFADWREQADALRERLS